ncbi:cytochrome P450 6j1-like [Aethina tumida]|uniref:cytochrome P450 6j1-like n=1 Tax=Aethina tumida TaxID=116153 RepID=UPI002148D591|nr:cytochrome P450 6j1-like [Aethina tumida]
MFWWLLIIVLSLAYALNKFIFGYWDRLKVPGPTPSFFIGNLGPFLFGKRTIHQFFNDIYKDWPGYPFVGIYKSGTPALLVRDPDLLKAITVRNFKSFYDNDVYLDKKNDPILGRNPFFLRGEEWKQTRGLLTPCFTSGKMKTLFPLIDNVSRKLVNYINKQIDANNPTLELKDVCTKTTLENVAISAFGLEAKCFENPESEFKQLADKFLTPGGVQSYKMMLIFIMPWLSKILSLKLVTNEIETRLVSLLEETVEYREKNNVQRNDYLNTLMQLRQNNPNFTMIDVVANAATFFGDGYETSSIVMSFALFELALNQDVQDKLRDEIVTKIEENNGELTYELVAEMEYLDACLSESMRTYPIITVLSKVCTEKFTYQTTNTKDFKPLSVTIEPGTGILLPWGSFFKDENYFPDSDKYIPERFLKENNSLSDVARGLFKPFGDGPRACLGQRFGQLQIKVAMIHILKNFRVNFNKKTKMPLTFDPIYIMLAPVGGLWVDFEKL